MNRRNLVVTVLFGLVAASGPALAHITPPVVLASDRDAVVGLLPGAQRYFVREVRLSAKERAEVARRWGWQPDEDFYRFYIGRDAQGRIVGATIFLTEYTVHGPLRVAVGIGPDGRVSGVRVVELTEETYAWLKPLLDAEFTRDWVGRGAGERFGPGERLAHARLAEMPRFYAGVVAALARRAAVLYEAAVAEAPKRS